MIKPFRTLLSALFLLSVFSFASCCRNTCDDFCPPACEPRCAPRCEPVCAPRCAPRCEPVCAPRCAPVCPQPCAPRCEPACPQPCAPACPQPCAPACPQPCAPKCVPSCPQVQQPVCPQVQQPVCPQPQQSCPTCPSYNYSYDQGSYGYQGQQDNSQQGYTQQNVPGRYQPCAPCGQPCAPRCAPRCAPACPQPCAPRCAPACPQPCAPRCAPACPQPCAPKCAPTCAPRCAPVCPQPCAPRCEPRCRPAVRPCRPFCPPRCAQPCAPVCPQPCAPKCAPACPQPCAPVCPQPCGQAPICPVIEQPCVPQPKPDLCYGDFRTTDTCDDCTVRLIQVCPSYATVGTPYPIELTMIGERDSVGIVVTQNLSEDAEFVSADPQPQINGRQLIWTFDNVRKGESRHLVIWIKPTKEGCCEFPATVCACPQLCGYVRCGQPVLCIQKCGPDCVCVDCEANYTITISNTGSMAAHDVVVVDTIPEGLVHCSGQRTLTYNVGTLNPCETKIINVPLIAVRRGRVCNTATVSYCGGPQCSAEYCTLINSPCVKVSKTGPDCALICKPVDYTITVTNPGDLVLRDVIVEDVAPSGTTVVSAPGAEICCNRATWTICELCPGETQTFCMTIRSQVTGNLCNKVTVTSQSDCGCCTESAEVCTCFRGIPAIHMCMVDTQDPICIGDTTVYHINVVNQGSADDNNVQLVVRFSSELAPLSANGPTPGQICGDTVTFAPIQKLGPKQTADYTITVKGVNAGDARVEATLSSDMLSTPVTDTESTHVY